MNMAAILNVYKRKQAKDKLILIPILDADENTIGFLHPITADFDRTIPNCVQLLDRWREDNPTLSPSRFPITHERKRRWVMDLIVNNDRRILFMLQDLRDQYIGHIGFTNIDSEHRFAEVDMVLRGEPTEHTRFMHHAMEALVEWGKQELLLKHIDLVVLPHNDRAISFYSRCGFQNDGFIPLVKIEANGEVSWERCPKSTFTSEYYFIHMTLC